MLVTFMRWFLIFYLVACSTFLLLNYLYFSNPHNFRDLDYDLFTDNNYAQTKIALFPEDSLQTDRILEQINYVPKNLKSKPVVIRLDPSLSSFGVKYGRAEFNKSACLVQNCFLIENPDHDADAIVFYQEITMNSRTNPDQIWILYQLEPPENIVNYTSFNNVINWTATYRWDSDLVTPYERFTPRLQVPSDQRLVERPNNDPQRNYAEGKDKKVAWFASNCVTSNKRELYAKELSQHISVDIYGLCGEHVCPRAPKYKNQCSQLLDEEYKFYLAFENSNCDDYVTEKFFVNGLQHDIIPIVMGASKSHYLRISPPHSFIHTDDFSHPSDLAKYLDYLDANDTAYNQYFKWKGTGQFIDTKFWCRLCALLNDPRQKTYQNLEKWFRTDKCRKGRMDYHFRLLLPDLAISVVR